MTPYSSQVRTVRAQAWRAPLALVAVFVVIVLVVGVLAGGRLARDWNNYLHRPVPAGQTEQRELQLLETRPVDLPSLTAQDPCYGGPFDQATGWWGTGPVHLQGFLSAVGHPSSAQWAGRPAAYTTMAAYVPEGLSGPVLIRGRNLVDGEPFVFVGEFSAGSDAGIGSLNGTSMQQRSEAVIDTGHPPAPARDGFVSWSVTVGFHLDAPSGSLNVAGRPLGSTYTVCGGWQIDGAGFSETVRLPY
jgi:hypothetical protein